MNRKLTAAKEHEESTSKNLHLQKVLGLGGIKETDFDRRVRLGEITPFGSSALDSTKNLEREKTGSSSSLHSYFQDQLKRSRSKGKQTMSPSKKSLDKHVKSVKEWTKNKNVITLSEKIDRRLKKDVKNLKKLKLKQKGKVAGSKIDYDGKYKNIKIRNNTGYSDDEFVVPNDEPEDEDVWGSFKSMLTSIAPDFNFENKLIDYLIKRNLFHNISNILIHCQIRELLKEIIKHSDIIFCFLACSKIPLS